uniref:S100P-binding protein n=1 Tax=Calidris pygmaea TaxID=425635 RepID=A0A8C3KDI3_9CHAR
SLCSLNDSAWEQALGQQSPRSGLPFPRGCFDDSEPDDSLLELSDNEVGNSPFNYTEEEIQEILADDRVESEWYLMRKSTLSQNVNGGSEKDESSSCTGASVISEDASVASEITETPNEPPSRECSSLGSEPYPSLSNESVSLDEHHLQSAQVTRMLFDLDIEELLSLSPIDADDVDQPLEDDSLEKAKRKASQENQSDCLEFDKTASNCVLEECLEELMCNGWQSLGVGCLGETPFASRDVPDSCDDQLERSMPSSDPACGQSPAEERSAPRLPRCPTPSSGSRNRELSKATKRYFSRKLNFLEDHGEQESSAAEQVCFNYFTYFCRNYSRSNKKSAQKYSLMRWVSKNLAKHHHFQSIPDHFHPVQHTHQ